MKTNFGKGLLAFSEGKYEQAFTFFEKSHRENIPPDIIFKVANEIILNDQKPNAFAIHCF